MSAIIFPEFNSSEIEDQYFSNAENMADIWENMAKILW
jgi:hypothetical protein